MARLMQEERISTCNNTTSFFSTITKHDRLLPSDNHRTGTLICCCCCHHSTCIARANNALRKKIIFFGLLNKKKCCYRVLRLVAFQFPSIDPSHDANCLHLRRNSTFHCQNPRNTQLYLTRTNRAAHLGTPSCAMPGRRVAKLLAQNGVSASLASQLVVVRRRHSIGNKQSAAPSSHSRKRTNSSANLTPFLLISS